MTNTVEGSAAPPREWLRHPLATLRSELGDMPAGPAILFAALNAFDELDAAAYGLFGPEIVQEFNISAATLGLVSLPMLMLGLVLPMIAGQATDRFNRVHLAVGGGLVWFLAAVATGIVPTLFLFVIVRALTSVGKSVAGPTHTSLLSDYYPVRGRGLAFSFHANSQALGQFLGAVLAAWIAVTWDWRVSFIVLPIPGLIIILLIARLGEPERGAFERQEVGEENWVELEPLPLRESLALLNNIKSWRTYAIVWFFLAAGLAMSLVLPFYLEATFGVGIVGRGWVLGALALLSGAGAMLGGILGQRAMKRGDYAAVGRLVTWSMLVSGVSLLALAAAPALPVALSVMLFTTPLRAMAAVPVTLVLSATVPVRIRGQGFGAIWVFFSLGMLLVPVSLAFGDRYSFRVSLLLGVVPMLIGAAYARLASTQIGSDIQRVNRLSGVEVEMRRRREAGEPIHLLEVVGLDVSYGTVQVLFGVDMHVEQGETVALLGTNGAGKSTLLRAVSGLVRPGNGLVLFDGEEITGLPAETVTERGIVHVPGGRGVFPGLTVERNLQLGAYLYRDDEQHIDTSLEEVVDLFPRLGERLDQPAGTMSGGEQQMLAIAQAFMAKPKILVIDELSLGLAPAVVQDLLEVIERINATGMTILLVEQSLNIALELADRAYFMEKGEIRFEGPAQELLERGDIVRSVFLEAGDQAAPADEPVATARDRAPGEEAEASPLLSIRDLKVSFGGLVAVDIDELHVPEGRIVGLVGSNGAGKTTLFDVISGFQSADRGSIVFDGDIELQRGGFGPSDRSRLGIARSFQNATLFESMTVAETLSVACERHLERQAMVGQAVRGPRSRRQSKQVGERVEELVEELGLGAYHDKFIAELSTGTRRIVDIGCVLAHRPRLLLLDEPSSGIAQREVEALEGVLRHVLAELDCTLFVIEHDIPMIRSLSDELYALETGQVIAHGDPSTVLADPEVVRSYLGTDTRAVERSGGEHPTT